MQLTAATPFPVDWVSRLRIQPVPIYVDALRITARAADRKVLIMVRIGPFADGDERVIAIQRYLLES